MFGLRRKLLLGYFGLFAIAAVLGLYGAKELSDLGPAVDIILKENYKSVLACQHMKEALERIDSGAVHLLMGATDLGNREIDENLRRFAEALETELGNITLPGEGDLAQGVRDAFAQYDATLKKVRGTEEALSVRRETYFSELLPTFNHIKTDLQH